MPLASREMPCATRARHRPVRRTGRDRPGRQGGDFGAHRALRASREAHRAARPPRAHRRSRDRRARARPRSPLSARIETALDHPDVAIRLLRANPWTPRARRHGHRTCRDPRVHSALRRSRTSKRPRPISQRTRAIPGRRGVADLRRGGLGVFACRGRGGGDPLLPARAGARGAPGRPRRRGPPAVGARRPRGGRGDARAPGRRGSRGGAPRPCPPAGPHARRGGRPRARSQEAGRGVRGDAGRPAARQSARHYVRRARRVGRAPAELHRARALRTPDKSGKLSHLRAAADLFIDRSTMPDSAIPLLEEASVLDPEDRTTKVALADAFVRANRFTEARALLRAIIDGFAGAAPRSVESPTITSRSSRLRWAIAPRRSRSSTPRQGLTRATRKIPSGRWPSSREPTGRLTGPCARTGRCSWR